MKKDCALLLVEDDPVDVMAIERALKQHKVTNPLFVVNDGTTALDFLRHEGNFSTPESSPRPCIILMDLKMPRMGGLECLRIIKNDPNLLEIPVVIFTSSTDEMDVRDSYINGAASYIVKPVTFEKLIEAISKFELYWTMTELP